MCSKSPSTAGINAAAQSTAQTSADSAKWFQNYVDSTQPQRDATTALDNQVAGAQLSGMSLAQQEAKDLDTRNKTVFQPVEDKIVSDAQGYDTPARRDAAAAAAMSEVGQNVGAQTAANNRALGRAGIAPGSAKSMSMNGDMGTMAALAEQGAAQKARNQVETTGHAMEMDAAGLGKGIVGNQATMLNTGTNAGTAAAGASGAGLTAATSAAPLMQTGYSQALQGQQITGNLYSQAGQLSQSNMGGMMAGVGGLMQGAGAMGWSSKELKTDKTPVDGKQALDAVNKLNIEGWDYKPGVADSGTHVGAYAEDTQKAMGNDVAPGGQMVNLPKMADYNTKAIGEATKQLAAIEAQIARLTKGRARAAA